MSLTALERAVAVIGETSPPAVSFAVVLGSGLSGFVASLEVTHRLPYASIPHFPPCTVAGHAGELVFARIAGVPAAVLSGRAHYYEGHAIEQVTFPVRVLCALGVKGLLLTCAAGGVNPSYAPGDLMVLGDHLNLTGTNPLRGPNVYEGPRFPDMSEVYDRAGRAALHAAARTLGHKLHEGVYAGVSGPSYETPAEVRMLGALGADAVGMSTVAEATVAVHGGMKVAALALISNLAAGLAPGALTHEEVVQASARASRALTALLETAAPPLAAALTTRGVA